MPRHAARALALALSLAPALAPAPSRAGDDWQRMVVADLSRPSVVGRYLEGIWHDRLAAQPPGTARAGAAVQYAVYPLGTDTLVVSVLSDASCRPAATPDALHAVCPGRVSVLAPAGPRSVDVDGACFMQVDGVWTPGVDPARNGVWADFDAERRVATIVAVRDGAAIPGCSRTVSP
jgi:hypothetical protein